MAAPKFKLDNLIAIVDWNNGQIDGPVDEVMPIEPLFARHPSTGSVEGVGLKRFPEREPRERELHRLF